MMKIVIISHGAERRKEKIRNRRWAPYIYQDYPDLHRNRHLKIKNNQKPSFHLRNILFTSPFRDAAGESVLDDSIFIWEPTLKPSW